MLREEFEYRAVRALTCVPPYVWDGDSLPIPVEEIAEEVYCLKVCRKTPAQMLAAPGAPQLPPDEKLSGLLLTNRGELWVNAEEAEQSEGRKRFTICHELGHWVMHRHTHPRPLFCRAHGMTQGEEVNAAGPIPKRPDLEIEAHCFAAAMLMPLPFVQREYETWRETGGDDFFELCRKFGASGAAMGRRLHQVI